MSGHTPGRDFCRCGSLMVCASEDAISPNAAPDLLAALLSVMHDGHYAECLNGKRGNAPDDHSNSTGARCSNRCIEFRAAIAKAGR